MKEYIFNRGDMLTQVHDGAIYKVTHIVPDEGVFCGWYRGIRFSFNKDTVSITRGVRWDRDDAITGLRYTTREELERMNERFCTALFNLDTVEYEWYQ